MLWKCCTQYISIFGKLSSSHSTGKGHLGQWHPTPVLLPGKSHGLRSLEGCSPWGRWGLNTTEWLHFHFSLSRIREGNGNPLQSCCLENPRDGGVWWAAVYGVAQSRTRLKWLSSKERQCQRMFKLLSNTKNKLLMHKTTCMTLKVYVKAKILTEKKKEVS